MHIAKFMSYNLRSESVLYSMQIVSVHKSFIILSFYEDVSAVLLLDGTRLLHFVLCLENASELSHTVLHVRCQVA